MYTLCSDFTNCHTTVLFLVQNPIQDNSSFTCHVSLLSLNLEQSSNFIFHDLDHFEEEKQFFCGMSFNLSVSEFFS